MPSTTLKTRCHAEQRYRQPEIPIVLSRGCNYSCIYCGVKLYWKNATVPGCVHLDLLANDLIPEPFYGTNEKDVQWISDKDWSYKLIFEPKPDLLNQKTILLKFNGLDTYAEVLLNEKQILETDNMFHPWEADVKGLLKEGDNELLVHFFSPINFKHPTIDLTCCFKNDCDLNSNSILLFNFFIFTNFINLIGLFALHPEALNDEKS